VALQQRDLAPARSEVKRHLTQLREGCPDRLLALRRGHDQEKAARPGAQQLAAACPRLARPLIPAIHVTVADAVGDRALELPVAIEQWAYGVHLASAEGFAQLVGEVPHVSQSRYRAPVHDGLALLAQHLRGRPLA